MTFVLFLSFFLDNCISVATELKYNRMRFTLIIKTFIPLITLIAFTIAFKTLPFAFGAKADVFMCSCDMHKEWSSAQ